MARKLTVSFTRREGNERGSRPLREDAAALCTDTEFSPLRPGWRLWAARAPLAECETSGLGCSCPSTGCQEDPGLSGPQRLLDHRLSSPGLPDGLDTTVISGVYFQICLLILSLRTFPTSTCLIYSLCQSPRQWSFFPSFHIPKLRDLILTRRRKSYRLYLQ